MIFPAPHSHNALVQCVCRASTDWFLFSFQTATDGTFANLYSNIQDNPDSVVQSVNEGFAKVRSEKYAFITDETTIARISEDCSIALITEKFYKAGFGLAFPEGWPYKKYFDKGWVCWFTVDLLMLAVH